MKIIESHWKESPLKPSPPAKGLIWVNSFGQGTGVNVEYVPAEMIKNGAEVIHLTTGFVVSYPSCPYTIYFKNFIESYYELPVVIGTHLIPLKYLKAHKQLPSMVELEKQALYLLREDQAIMKAYN